MNMDIKKKKTKSLPRKKAFTLLIGTTVLALGTYFSMTLSAQNYQVKSTNLTISPVIQGEMSVEVRGNGILVPKHIRWISNNVDGRAEFVAVKPGAMVEKGDLIVELTNPELVQKTEEIRWELEAAQANLNALKMRHENNVLNSESNVIKAKHEYDKANLEFQAETTLLNRANGSVSKIDYDRSRLDTEQYLQRWHIEKQRLAKLITTQDAEYLASSALLNQLKKSLSRSEYLLHSLKVVANQNGVIQAINIESGQRVPVGNSIAKLAKKDELLAEIDIPERQVRDVAIGQNVTIKTHNNQIKGNVSRIDPAVVNGTVQVDVTLTGELPPEARPDLSIQGTIEISNLQETLYVKRPTFAQNNEIGTVFQLSPDGTTATRVNVRFGKGSADSIEVKSGLNVSDRIITSNTNAWSHLDLIGIN
ncbi:efflux RND transporter periplasmic adaptor subunit [Vibrio splendidus]